VTKEWNLPQPLPGAEWQIDTKFGAADPLLQDTELRTVFMPALDNGAEGVVQRRRTVSACAFQN